MNEEYEFRGLTEYGKWVFGGTYDDYIIQDTKAINLNCVLLVDRITRVIPNTIGQYTGRKESRNLVGDYDKKKIYKGDIIKSDGWDDLYLVEFEDCKFVAKKIWKHNGDIFTRYDKDLDDVLFPIVVGNKFENYELLKKGE